MLPFPSARTERWRTRPKRNQTWSISLVGLGRNTRENSANSSQGKRHGAAARDGWLALTRLRTRTPYAGRGTHGVLCGGCGGPHASGDWTAAAMLCCVSVWRLAAAPASSFSFVACELCWFVGDDAAGACSSTKTRNRGGKGLTLCSFFRAKDSPVSWRPALCPEEHEIDDVASTAFYIGVLCWFLFRHPVTFCILYLYLASFEGSKWCFKKI